MELDSSKAPGAPLFRSQFTARVTDLCMLGLTNVELASRFEVSQAVFDRWIIDVPEFRAAIFAGREGADAAVANALFRAATGYEHPEDDIRTISLGNNQGSELVITPTTKHYPPSDRAVQMWLGNRQRNRWNVLNQAQVAGSATEQAQAARAAIAAAMAEEDEPKEQP